jgi:hypothetical protein
MSSYNYSDVFQNKDATNAVILGSEFHTEFNKIEVAVNSKADTASPTFTGTVTLANLTATGTVTMTIDGGTY